MDPHDRFKNYDKDHCWQHEMRLQNLDEDLEAIGLTAEEAATITVDNLDFEYVSPGDKKKCSEIVKFIERHEWLGRMPHRPTHRFTARLQDTGILTGVLIMGNPYADEKAIQKALVPDATTNIERLIARGASISWAPRNIASWILMRSINWMVANTKTRMFTAYSDPEAKELGTVYQAANFIYMGQTSGTARQYRDPYRPDRNWFSDREFRKGGKWDIYAMVNLGIPEHIWRIYKPLRTPQGKKVYTPNWDIMPKAMKLLLEEEVRKYKDRCVSRPVPAKHKYMMIQGNGPAETKRLKKRFTKAFPNMVGHQDHRLGLPYPTERGK